MAWAGLGGRPTTIPPHPIQVADHREADGHPSRRAGPRGTVTLAFAGDVHFQLHLAALLEHPRGALGPVTHTLKAADLTMVNLESSITDLGTPEAKEREVASQRFYYRTSPAALDVLAAAGVDVVTMANNHGADYGPVGLNDTLAAIRTSPIPVIGIGRDRAAALAPYRVSIRGTRFAFLAADASMREGSSNVWAAGAATPGIAAARDGRPPALIAAVRAASRQDDVVVVYLHWGAELQGCPTLQQRTIAKALAEAGADVIVGSHAHMLLGSGWLGGSYVDYGLGNFLWYHNHQPETGVLRLTIRDGQVVGDAWTPARIQTYGRPLPLPGRDRADAIADWRRLRGCTDLAALRSDTPLPAYSWSERRLGPLLRQRMRFSHHPGCPVPLTDLRYLQMSYIGFDGRAHIGEMVVHKDYAGQIATVFGRLYDARWPIGRMRLVDDYGGSDNRSMAANNTSGFNCRRVAGRPAWSAHAYGAAIDINPVQNPDMTGASVAPRAGRRFAATDRSADAHPPPGVITAAGPVVRAFARIGWEWGGGWSARKDYQHFSAPCRASIGMHCRSSIGGTAGAVLGVAGQLAG
jgi:poly-gamma-glutamate synthesis protein (capsule biosynthesis protein)